MRITVLSLILAAALGSTAQAQIATPTDVINENVKLGNVAYWKAPSGCLYYAGLVRSGFGAFWMPLTPVLRSDGKPECPDVDKTSK